MFFGGWHIMKFMKHRNLRGFSGVVAILIASSAAQPAVAADLSTATDKPKLVVVDIELTGDLGGPQFTAEHDARLQMESDKLRQELRQSGLYTVVDSAPAQTADHQAEVTAIVSARLQRLRLGDRAPARRQSGAGNLG